MRTLLFQRSRCCHFNLMRVGKTYNFCRSIRFSKMWGGSSIIILLDRSLWVTVKEVITLEINDILVTLHNYHHPI